MEQYLRFFTEYRQRDWPEWLAITEFVVNNKIHTAIRVLLFIANYRRELIIGANIRRKEKVEKAIEFVERIKKVQKKVGVVLKKTQEDMKRQVDKGKREVEE